MTALATAEPFALARRVGVGVAALAFVGAIVWQVVTQRDDWPLSSFKMYSNLQGATASRSFVRGVSDEGEFELADEMLPVGGARLRHLNDKLSRNQKRQRRFVALIQERYEARRQAHGWPVLQAVRAYTETWKIKVGLAGIDRPKRRMSGALYLPPNALLERLELEAEGKAQPAASRAKPAADTVLDLDASACGEGCELFEDRYAASGRALRLSADEDDGVASVTVPLTLPKGEWALLVRMRTPKRGGGDRLYATLDGERLGGKAGIGNYQAALGRGAWVWASQAPGERALSFEVKRREPRVLRLEVSDDAVELDEVWITPAPRELPTWNEPLAP